MARGRVGEAWNHTANLMAVVLNLMRKRPISPARLHPFGRRRDPRPLVKMTPGDSFDAMAGAFLRI